LRALDRALVLLLEERARLVAELELEPREARPALEDLTRRHRGRLGAPALEELLALAERLTRPAASGEKEAR
jgi:hypothetical protein